MEIRGTEFVALATDGDVQLGGYDWDQRLVDLVAEEFIRQHDLDPREDPSAAGKLWRECEDAKRTLSARSKASVSCDYKGHAVRVEITREQFEELTQDLLDRTRFTTAQTLQAAGLDWNDLDRVLLVGGSTRMPMVAHDAPRALRQGARRLGGGRRGGGPRRGPARRRSCSPSGRASRRCSRSGTSTRTAWAWWASTPAPSAGATRS